ncbi:competence protein ComK [Staphylococcus pseudoxylosus]|uniref:competence protein ComK n=1 Tax=Staphylococcus pseudoxylosus TaxID=2282419 RepID=UPI002DB80930|nr:competence protein ComK [Staphylococcus pseudoxylosus]MEB7752301.1 competence protein ComK [Staphylococcus pseudoxylosus]
MSNLTKILYFKTAIGPEILTICQFTTHQFIYPSPINQTINYVLEKYHRSHKVQLEQSKRILKIKKLVPIFIDYQTTIFPVKPQRSPIQYYINACTINGLKSKGSSTIVYFDNGTFITVDAPYIFIYKKWQESLTLSHLLS